MLLVSRRYQTFRGQIFLLFTFGYGICRFLLEMLRADDERGFFPPSLPEHILLPLAVALFSIGWLVGPSRMIENPTMRKLTQVLAFVPPAVLFLALRPESFGTSATIELSTSQAVALSTGVAAAFAFRVYHEAALAHPEAAMAIPVPAEVTDEDETAKEKPASRVADEDEDEGEESVNEEAAPKPKKKKKKVSAQKKVEPTEPSDSEGEES